MLIGMSDEELVECDNCNELFPESEITIESKGIYGGPDYEEYARCDSCEASYQDYIADQMITRYQFENGLI